MKQPLQYSQIHVIRKLTMYIFEQQRAPNKAGAGACTGIDRLRGSACSPEVPLQGNEPPLFSPLLYLKFPSISLFVPFPVLLFNSTLLSLHINLPSLFSSSSFSPTYSNFLPLLSSSDSLLFLSASMVLLL